MLPVLSRRMSRSTMSQRTRMIHDLILFVAEYRRWISESRTPRYITYVFDTFENVN